MKFFKFFAAMKNSKGSGRRDKKSSRDTCGPCHQGLCSTNRYKLGHEPLKGRPHSLTYARSRQVREGEKGYFSSLALVVVVKAQLNDHPATAHLSVTLHGSASTRLMLHVPFVLNNFDSSGINSRMKVLYGILHGLPK